MKTEFEVQAQQYFLDGQKLRIASDINGTLMGLDEKQLLGDKEVDLNIRLMKFLVQAHLAGHDVAIFSNDPNGNAITFQLLERKFFPIVFDEIGIDSDKMSSVLADLFGRQEDGSYWLNHKSCRDDVAGFEKGCDFVFEDEDASWASPFSMVFRPGSDIEVAFLDGVVANPDQLQPVVKHEFLPLPWADLTAG